MTPATVAAGACPYAVAIDPSGRSAYVADNSGDAVLQFTIGPGGALTPMSAGSVAAGRAPAASSPPGERRPPAVRRRAPRGGANPAIGSVPSKQPWERSMPRRTAVAVVALAAASLLTAAAPRPGSSAAALPAPSGVAPPADEDVIVGSCEVSRTSCIDYQGTFAGGDAAARCKKAGGTWRAAPCPGAGRVGTCRVRDPGTDDRVLTRFYAPVVEQAARAECKKQPRAVFQAR